MGLDLDLAVSHPGSGFQESYRARFAARIARAREALRVRGLELPEERPLPSRFDFRRSLGTYSSGGARLLGIHDFVDHLRQHRALPGLAAPEESEALRALLLPLEGAPHLPSGPGPFFVPVDFAETIPLSLDGEATYLASIPRALPLLRLLGALDRLDEKRCWDLLPLIRREPGEPFAGYRFFTEGFPAFPALEGVWQVRQAAEDALTYGVCFALS